MDDSVIYHVKMKLRKHKLVEWYLLTKDKECLMISLSSIVLVINSKSQVHCYHHLMLAYLSNGPNRNNITSLTVYFIQESIKIYVCFVYAEDIIQLKQLNLN